MSNGAFTAADEDELAALEAEFGMGDGSSVPAPSAVVGRPVSDQKRLLDLCDARDYQTQEFAHLWRWRLCD